MNLTFRSNPICDRARICAPRGGKFVTCLKPTCKFQTCRHEITQSELACQFGRRLKWDTDSKRLFGFRYRYQTGFSVIDRT